MSSKWLAADLIRAGGALILVLGVADALKAAILLYAIFTATESLISALPFLSQVISWLGIALVAAALLITFPTVAACIASRRDFEKVSDEVLKGGLAPETRSRWMRSVTVELLASIICGALLTALCLLLILLGLSMSPVKRPPRSAPKPIRRKVTKGPPRREFPPIDKALRPVRVKLEEEVRKA